MVRRKIIYQNKKLRYAFIATCFSGVSTTWSANVKIVNVFEVLRHLKKTLKVFFHHSGMFNVSQTDLLSIYQWSFQVKTKHCILLLFNRREPVSKHWRMWPKTLDYTDAKPITGPCSTIYRWIRNTNSSRGRFQWNSPRDQFLLPQLLSDSFAP